MLVVRRGWGRRAVAIGARELRRRFVPRERTPCVGMCRGCLGAAEFADPAGQFVAVVMRIAAIGQRRRRAVLERQQRGIGAVARARFVPIAGDRADRADRLPREPPHDIDLMRALAEYHPAAARRIELLRAARAIDEIGEVEGQDLAQRAMIARGDQSGGGAHRRVEPVARPDHQHAIEAARRLRHRRAIGDGDRHRLFDQHMLARLDRGDRLRGMMFVRRGDIERIDIRRAEHRPQGRKGGGVELLHEAFARLGTRIERPRQHDPLVARQRGQGEHEAASQPDHPQPDPVHCALSPP